MWTSRHFLCFDSWVVHNQCDHSQVSQMAKGQIKSATQYSTVLPRLRRLPSLAFCLVVAHRGDYVRNQNDIRGYDCRDGGKRRVAWDASGQEESRGMEDTCERRTVPYVLLRCEIRCNRDDTERETEGDELVQYSRAVGGTSRGWEKRKGGIASYPCSMVCVLACAEAPRALILHWICLGGGVRQAWGMCRARMGTAQLQSTLPLDHVPWTSIDVTPQAQGAYTSGLQVLPIV
jgi:hypothetical protein